jgi:hypothetical protein
VEITAPPSVQAAVFEATKSFGESNGFAVSSTNQLPREGRLVSQVDLQRGDGVMMTLDNFMEESRVTALFYAKQSRADWRTTQSKWLEVVDGLVRGRGEITVVPVEGNESASER